MDMQIKKNTVSARNQLPKKEYVTFIGDVNADMKIAFVGNSITRHGEAPQIGWNHNFGMAASAIENDYVHRVIHKLEEKYDSVSACVCNAFQWETHYQEEDATYHYFQSVKAFHPDVLVMRLIENCSLDVFDFDIFRKEYEKFVDYLADEHTKIIFTTSFWKHPGDKVIEEVAKLKNSTCIYLGDLGEQDEMKAIGLFENSGVANHPGDLGMQAIAERILKVL